MVEMYSELWVNINCHYNSEQKTEIREAWQSLLAKYAEYGIMDDKHDEMFQRDVIHFGIAADDSVSKRPNYKEQYRMFGEFVRAIQEILKDWELDIHIQKTGMGG
jgi:hypothetical protein